MTTPDYGRRHFLKSVALGTALSAVSQAADESVPQTSSANDISHGPMLGAVGETSAAIWLRTSQPGRVTIRLFDENRRDAGRAALDTTADADHCAVARFDSLKPDSTYRYRVQVEQQVVEARFNTTGPSMKQRSIRLVFGSCYLPDVDSAQHPVFAAMARRGADFNIFLGDFPYTVKGELSDVRRGHQRIRIMPGFHDLTRDTPTYAIWDDHDFGPNDTDGRHPFADQALQGFREYWANFTYGESDNPGIYSRFLVGNVEVFLLDGRYHARQNADNPTQLGKRQFAWLLEGLKESTARYKVLASGTPFTRVKTDAWGGAFYRHERDAIFQYIRDHHITGVLGISGDIHRVDIHRLPMGPKRWFYDFTSSPLSQNFNTAPPEAERDPAMIFAHGERRMFCELNFHPPADADTAITFRAFSPARTNPFHEHVVTPHELGLAQRPA